MTNNKILQITEKITLSSFGIFDSKSSFPSLKQSSGRVTTEFEIEFILDCTGKAIVNNTEYKLYPSTLLLCKPGQKRRSIFSFRCYFLHFSLSKDSPYYKLLCSAPDFYRIIDGIAYADIFSDLLYHLTENEKEPCSDYAYAKMLELFYFLSKDAERNRTYLAMRSTEQRSEDFVPTLISYIRGHYGDKISLESLSSVFHYSPNYIQSVFRRVTGATPKQYLEQIRLQQAKVMLAERKESISQIALTCGFYSQSHFTASFKNRFGLTPKRWQTDTDMTIRQYYLSDKVKT